MKSKTAFALAFLLIAGSSQAAGRGVDPLYREMSLRVRSAGSFQVPSPSGTPVAFDYVLRSAKPWSVEPITSDVFLDPGSGRFVRRFIDKIALEDGSHLALGGEKVPLTCVFVDGRDNRFSGKESPLIPDFVLRVYLVANDFSCTGPINPAWPRASSRRETWDTYLYFEVRDPTVMLPTEIRLRQRWMEYPAVLRDGGGGSP